MLPGQPIVLSPKQAVDYDTCDVSDSFVLWTSKRPVPLQRPGTPKPQKCILKSEKCHFGPPGKMARQVNENVQKARFWELKCPKTGFLDILIDFSGHFFPGGPKWHFSDFKMHFWGFGVPGLCRGTGRLQLWTVEPGGLVDRMLVFRDYHWSKNHYTHNFLLLGNSFCNYTRTSVTQL